MWYFSYTGRIPDQGLGQVHAIVVPDRVVIVVVGLATVVLDLVLPHVLVHRLVPETIEMKGMTEPKRKADLVLFHVTTIVTREGSQYLVIALHLNPDLSRKLQSGTWIDYESG